MRKGMNTKALILESCLGCRRVNGVTSNGEAGEEIFGVEVKTNGSENRSSGAVDGPQTRGAIPAFESRNGLAVDGRNQPTATQ